MSDRLFPKGFWLLLLLAIVAEAGYLYWRTSSAAALAIAKITAATAYNASEQLREKGTSSFARSGWLQQNREWAAYKSKRVDLRRALLDREVSALNEELIYLSKEEKWLVKLSQSDRHGPRGEVPSMLKIIRYKGVFRVTNISASDLSLVAYEYPSARGPKSESRKPVTLRFVDRSGFASPVLRPGAEVDMMVVQHLPLTIKPMDSHADMEYQIGEPGGPLMWMSDSLLEAKIAVLHERYEVIGNRKQRIENALQKLNLGASDPSESTKLNPERWKRGKSND